MSDKLHDEIYLFESEGEVVWCQDKLEERAIKYIRADIFDSMENAWRRECDELRHGKRKPPKD
jgi:hypothetical protein